MKLKLKNKITGNILLDSMEYSEAPLVNDTIVLDNIIYTIESREFSYNKVGGIEKIILMARRISA